MSGIDWSFVIGCWLGSAAACALDLVRQARKRRREREQRARERAARMAEADAAFVAFLQDVSRKLEAEIKANRATLDRMRAERSEGLN